jgi:hypothetical protein
MIFANEKTIVVRGNIYTDMPFEPALLAGDGITIHSKRDIFFGIMERPNKMRTEDFYFSFEEFTKKYGPIKDLVAFSEI